MKASGRGLALVLLLFTVGCDRLTKNIAVNHLAGEPARLYLFGLLRLEYAENTGAFLSMGATLPSAMRTALLTGGVAVLLMVVALLAIRNRWTGACLVGAALMWAGGVSNLIDRAFQGSVVDFINLGIGSLRTGIFNVADIAVMLGAALILVGDIGSSSSSRRETAS